MHHRSGNCLATNLSVSRPAHLSNCCSCTRCRTVHEKVQAPRLPPLPQSVFCCVVGRTLSTVPPTSNPSDRESIQQPENWTNTPTARVATRGPDLNKRYCSNMSAMQAPLPAHFSTCAERSTPPPSAHPRHSGSTMSTGYSAIRTPSVNKGLAFTSKERDELKLRGLLPAGETSIKLETKRALLQLRKKSSPLEKYIFMQSMQDTNEAVYYRLLVENTAELMPIVYTPTVGQACLEFSHIYRQTPRGLYISIKDVGRVAELLDAWPEKDIRAIVFTDGERILGLGDLGVNGMGIPIGKLALYTACAGVPPHMCLPVVLDCGTNNTEFLEDELYIGLRQKREQGPLFEQLVDEFMNAAKAKYGPQVLLQFEDFGNSTAFHLLRKYENTHCTFNDDIQGTASVVLAGLLAAVPLSGKSLAKHTFLFMGAGEAGTGIADLIARAIGHETGKTLEEAREQIWLVDSRGLVVASRKDSLQHHKLLYAHEAPECKTLEEAIDRIKPSALIGVCTIPKTFSKEVCEKMTALNERPIIFALSNPTSKAECTAEEAYTFTDGKCIFASGSPFDPVEYNGKRFVPGQGNNSYIFPGVGLACVGAGLTHVDDEIMIIAAETLAKLVTPADLETGCVYPPLSAIRSVSLEIAAAVAEYGYSKGFATTPRPADIKEHLRSIVYNP